jgi:RNA polymerase sigma-70 factor (ECF subfamily)
MRSLPSERLALVEAATPSNDRVEDLFIQYERSLGQFLAQVTKSRSLAEDLLQETFLVAVRERDQLPTVANVEAWLFGIARNRALDALRKRRRTLGAIERLTSRLERRQADSSEAVAVRDFLVRNVPPEDRILLVLRYVHGFGARELGEMTGRSPEAVRQQLSRACRRLAVALDTDQRR